MKLADISIRHYKSLSEVKVHLDPQVTVVVGPNAVGKSNFVDALRFLRDVAKSGLEQAISSRHGMVRLRPSGMGKDKISLTEIEANWDDQTSSDPEDFSMYHVGLSAFEDGYIHESPMQDPARNVAAQVRNWRFSALNVAVLRTLSSDDSEGELREDGSNWATVIRSARRTAKGKKMLERINEAMRVVLPDFQEVGVTTAGSYLVPLFKFENGQGVTRSFDPVQLSDGTLRLFGILLAAYQSPPPALLVIEEPEQTIYPGALAVLADVFKEVGQTTQVIITTHSPHLVQYFAPEQIRVATMHHGLTSIRPIHPHQMEAVNEGLLSLEEFMTGEGLRPDDTQPQAS